MDDAADPQPGFRCPDCARTSAELVLLREQVAALTAQVQVLQERLHRDSSNSSRPPSSDPPWKPKPSRAKPRGRKRGGQPGHPGQQRAWVAPAALTGRHEYFPGHTRPSDPPRWPPAALTGRHEYFPVVCEHCQADLPAQTPLLAAVRAHQVYELPEIRPEITEHVRRGCCCPRCGRHTWAPLPPGVPPSGSGPRLQAVVALLTGKGQMSRRNVQACLTTWCGLPLALGTISKIERRMAMALAPAVQEVTAAVQAATVVYSDETRWREGKARPWLWAVSTVHACLFRILDHRDRASFAGLFGPDHADRTLVSDRYSAYLGFPAARHGFCWAHLDRDFLAVAQSGEPLAFLGRYALETVDALFALWHAYQAGELDRRGLLAGVEPLKTRLRTWITWGAEAGGRTLRGFFRQVEKHWESLWVFASTAGVEPTNNRSERLLRAGVRWRKTSYGTQSRAGRGYVESMLTVTGTLALQGRSVFAFLVAASQAALGSGEPPRLLPPRPEPQPP